VFGRFRETSLAAMDSEQRPQYAHFYGLDHPLPEHVPAFQGLIMDDQANVWLERYRQPWEEDSRYEIVDRQGRWLGQVEVPAKLRIFQIGTDFVLGRQVDSLGVERVRVHALRRGGGL
jgi:hypothetical protein